MGINTAISGMLAANTDLKVTGNNIANSSTVGFKLSRAELSDLYTQSMNGDKNKIGSGVRVTDVAQQFSQGTVSLTQGEMDLAINGRGFFVLNDRDNQVYTRAGQFKLDNDNFVVTNEGARLQGFAIDENGVTQEVLTDIQLNRADLAPASTTEVDMLFNLDADAVTPAVIFNTTSTEASASQAIQGSVNGFAAGTIEINGVTYSIPQEQNQSAAVIANSLSEIDGVNALAQTQAQLTIPTGVVGAGQLTINAQIVEGADLASLTLAIDSLDGITAVENGGVINITEEQGNDLIFTAAGGLTGTVTSSLGGPTITIDGSSLAPASQATVGGQINLTLNSGLSISEQTLSSAGNNLFSVAPTLTEVRQNIFDPSNISTYNYSRTTQIYDSLGVAHALTQYFVKQPPEVSGANTWNLHIKIDGQDVGDPDLLTPNTPTLATYTLKFFDNGLLDLNNSDTLLVSNWTPLDSEGNPAGALGPINVADGGTLPIAVPAISSNFLIDINNSTQFSEDFSVSQLDQNGFARGVLSGFTVSENGNINARYSNNESQVLGRVALANFDNQQGLRSIGDTNWAETNDSGPVLVGEATTSSFGSISSGALEDSNVELTEELVSLILAQRNFQANSQTLETLDELREAIINLR
jgi:flagellar hook protein FlgE